MKAMLIFSSWRVPLIQGVFMIALSILIFKNPEGVLAALALWLGVVVFMIGLVGISAYFSNAKEDRDHLSLLGQIVILIVGILMIAKLVVTMKAITFIFGLVVTTFGFLLSWGSWNERREWSGWWVITILGLVTLGMGIKSMMHIYAGAQNISTFMGISVLLSGIGLIFLAFLQKKIVQAIRR